MITLALVSRTSSQFVVSMTGAAGGETTFELEVCREPDFSSDDSIFKTALPAGNVTIDNVPAGTTYFCRMRSTNLAAPGPWSNTLLLSTSPPTSPAAYSGLSIAPVVVVVPQALQIKSMSHLAPGSSGSSLLDPDPNAVAVINAPAINTTILFETAGRPFDMIALLGCFCDGDFEYRLRLGDNPDPVVTWAFDTDYIKMHASSGLGQRKSYHGLIELSAPVSYKYGVLILRGPYMPPQMLVRNLVVGLQRKTQNYVRGSAQSVNDLGSLQRNLLGTPYVVQGWKGRKVDFGMEWLSETEYQAKWADLEQLVGTNKPVLAIPNSARNEYFHDRILFGYLTSIEGEHTRARRYAKSFSMLSYY